MKKTLLFSIAILAVGSSTYSQHSVADEYDFDWGSSRDMSGAFFICSLTGFTFNDGADCPKVLRRCLTDHRLLRFTWKGPESKCLDLASFFMSGEDTQAALVEASNRSESDIDVEAVALDFADNNDVIDEIEQDTNPDPGEYEGYIEGGYSGTVYAFAQDATENFADSDYFEFYYTGNGNEGGWGHPEYKKDYFQESVYTGPSASEVYESAYVEAFIEPEAEPVDTYEARRAAAIDVAITVAVTAENEQREVINDAYSSWRSVQPWDSFGYGLEEFEENYNLARTKAFYNAFLEAGSEPGCDMTCASAAGEAAADFYPITRGR